MGFKIPDKRRIGELRVGVGVKESFYKKLSRSVLTWAGHVERMGDEKLAQKVEKEKETRKAKIAMQHCIKRSRKIERGMENRSNR